MIKYNVNDFISKKFNRLTILSLDTSSNKNGKFVLVKCDCGKVFSTNFHSIIYEDTKSCGCYASDMLSARNKKHGLSKSRLYSIWLGIKKRCYDTNHNSYKNWGGRGVKMSQDWQNFSSFFKWSIENGYQNGLTIERIDNNGDYCESNCRWATKKEQANNTRRNRMITAWGETKTAQAWVEDKRCKVTWSSIVYRINIAKMTPEDAISKPPRNPRYGSANHMFNINSKRNKKLLNNQTVNTTPLD